MKTLLLAVCALVVSACATAQEKPEVIAYSAGLSYAELMAGGVPIVDGAFYNGISSMPEVVTKTNATAEIGTTKFEPFTSLTGSQQTDKYIQFVNVANLDTTGSICLYLESWSSTCSSTTAFTCLGASTQGLVTPPGTSRDFRFTGSNKVCAVGSEVGVDGQLERTVMYAR